jgi:hypothetical protein
MEWDRPPVSAAVGKMSGSIVYYDNGGIRGSPQSSHHVSIVIRRIFKKRTRGKVDDGWAE